MTALRAKFTVSIKNLAFAWRAMADADLFAARKVRVAAIFRPLQEAGAGVWPPVFWAVLFCALNAPVFAQERSGAVSGDHGTADMYHHMDHEMRMHPMPERGSYSVSTATYSIPDIKMTSADGSKVSIRELLDGHAPVFLNFIFTSCTAICPVMSSTFQHLQERLGPTAKDVRLISISIDPENDTPEKLKTYAAKFKAGPEWTLLTGTLEDSVMVQKAFGVFAGEKMSHKPITFIRRQGAQAQWRRIDGLAEANQIITEYDKLRNGE